MKRFLRIALLVIILLSVNLVYYVFVGQQKSTKKLTQHKELSLYECVSIYQMHCAVWMFGWPLSPEAAKECMLLHFPNKKDTVELKGYLSSPMLHNKIDELKFCGDSRKVRWNGHKHYSLNSPEHRVAIAVNPCTIVRTKPYTNDGYYYCVDVYSSMQYPKYSDTKFKIGSITISVQEGLFRYLQDKHWLNCFTVKYKTSNSYKIINEINKASK